MRVMVIGASRDRNKYGNKSLRAYLKQGHDVLPVNPNADTIEGLECFHNIAAVPGPIDRATLYVPPAVGLEVLEQIAQRDDVAEVWLNPGSDAPEVVEKAQQLGLNAIQACSIVAIGESP